MDTINQLIAQLVATFKQKNPMVFLVIVSLLMVVIYFAEQGTLLGIIELNEVWSQVLKWFSIVLNAAVGTTTFPFMSQSFQLEESKKTIARIEGPSQKKGFNTVNPAPNYPEEKR